MASEGKAMTESEMIEALADAEHASWARWMAYLFSKSPYNPAGHRVIPEGLVRRWQRQIDTPYADLTEDEKQSDRNEVALILPIIKARLQALLAERDAEIAVLVEALSDIQFDLINCPEAAGSRACEHLHDAIRIVNAALAARGGEVRG